MNMMVSGPYRVEPSLVKERKDWFGIWQGKKQIAIVNIITGESKISSFEPLMYFSVEDMKHFITLMEFCRNHWINNRE